ncbi:MAG: hypothetical protein ABIJ45_05865, partial [Candidatus Zixiibacteriota bacterium]
MIYRLIFFICLAGNLWAGDFYANWKPGHTEQLKYEIKTFQPKETISYQYLEIMRDADNKEILHINQVLDMPASSITIKSEEKYNISDLRLIESLNYFKFPPSAVERMGTDSVALKAFTKDDSLVIATRSTKLAVPGTIFFPSGSVTNTASSTLARDIDFKIGQTRYYKFINLLKLTGKAYQLTEASDSVIAIMEIDTPLGRKECFQVKNIVQGGYGYTYYMNDNRHLPVKV